MSLRIVNSLRHVNTNEHTSPLINTLPKRCFIKPMQRVFDNDDSKGNIYKAGPTTNISFKSNTTKVAIVNAGGLCPGINNVIYDLVYSLEKLYNVNDIYGIQYGFTGISKYNMLELCVKDVENIQHDRGSFLGTSRGVLDAKKVSVLLDDHKINQLYVIGGDGSHKGAYELTKHTDISIICIPKTIDNDLPVIDRSFGFHTATERAKEFIMAAYSEAKDTEYGLGIVKLMGRNCGWIALSASMASYNVDVCLIPEYEFKMDSLKSYLTNVMNEKGYCVLVIAEGISVPGYENEDIGLYFKQVFENIYNVKYIDPTYLIRAYPANTSDTLYCKMLAQSAVHAGMSGYSGITVGHVDNNMCIIPLEDVINKKNYVPEMMWYKLLHSNLQPDLN
jgi:6-phosphofructokinase 1